MIFLAKPFRNLTTIDIFFKRKLGWAHHLVCGWRALARGLAFFMVTVQLTEAGERHTDEVVKQVFQYIQLVKGWLRPIYAVRCCVGDFE